MKDSKIKNIKTELLSNNWYTLNNVTFDYLTKDGQWITQKREVYDRGNGAAILLYNKLQKSVVLIRQFRMPTYFNGNPTGMMLEVCAGLLDSDQPEQCILRETEEETGIRREQIRLDADFRFELSYPVRYQRHGDQIFQKTVVYLLGEIESPFTPTLTEHTSFEWFHWKPPHHIQSQTIDTLLEAVAAHYARNASSSR